MLALECKVSNGPKNSWKQLQREVGAVVGAAWMLLLRRLSDQTLAVAAATLLGWAAYIAGEALHVSGVIATVTAGIVFGWYQHVILPASHRLQGSAFWRTLVFTLEALVFTLEALVFILMGFSLKGVVERVGGIDAVFGTLALPALAVTASVIVARFAWVFGVEGLLKLLRSCGSTIVRPLGWRQASVLGWTGMRGVVTLAVALTLPVQMPGRDIMLVAGFTVILVTVVLQGGSLQWIIALVRPEDGDPPSPVGLPAAEAAIARAKLAAAEKLGHASDGQVLHPQLLETYRTRASGTERFANDADRFMAKIRPHFDLMLSVVAAGRAELIRLHREGQIEDEVLHDLERDLDIEEMGIVFQRGGDDDQHE